MSDNFYRQYYDQYSQSPRQSHLAGPDLNLEPPPPNYTPYAIPSSFPQTYQAIEEEPEAEHDEEITRDGTMESSGGWMSAEPTRSGSGSSGGSHQPVTSTYDALEHARIPPYNLDPELFVPAFVSPRFASGGLGAPAGAGPVVVEPAWSGAATANRNGNISIGRAPVVNVNVNVAVSRADQGFNGNGGNAWTSPAQRAPLPSSGPLYRRASGPHSPVVNGNGSGSGMAPVTLNGTLSSEPPSESSIMGPPPVPLLSTSASIYSRRYNTDPTSGLYQQSSQPQHPQQHQQMSNDNRRDSYPPHSYSQTLPPPSPTFQMSPTQPHHPPPPQRRTSIASSPPTQNSNVQGTTSDPASPVYDLYGSSVYSIQPPSLDTLRLSGQAVVAAAESMVAVTAPGGVVQGISSPTPNGGGGGEPPFDPGSLGLPLPPRKEDGETNWRGMYSTSGIDMITVLAKVAMRKNPEISIGPVDMGCSFLVVDARKFDNPIVYASETFTHLTGYSNAEILGRNCRFLQSPDGIVEAGSKRRYTDGNAVYHLKQHIVNGKETQASLINYAKGGRPFINLVTCIPITWESDEIAFFVGFQVDLVDQPAAILEKMKNGTYIVNYSVSAASVPHAPSMPSIPSLDTADTAGSDVVNTSGGRKKSLLAPPQPEALNESSTSDLLDVLAVKAQGVRGLAGDLMKKQFFKLLLDHCDDFIHVVSLKGSLLYVSDSVSRLLEYEPEELAGTSLSSICHPSDIVAVLRELKESGAPGHESVNILYRARRKHSGYVWMEGTGKLFVEQGKGRKCVILVGRPTDVLHVQWSSLEKAGGLGQIEFWAKLSVTGMVLHATPPVKQVLGLTSDEMSGRNILTVDENGELLEAIQVLVESGQSEVKTVRHRMKAKTGLVNVLTNLYPTGEAGEDLSRRRSAITVIAQTIRVTADGAYEGRRLAAMPLLSRSRSSSTSIQSVAGSSSGTGSSMSLPLPAFGGKSSDSETNGGSSGASSFSAIPSTFKTLTQAATDNVFDELDTTRGTSWQFELHQLRLQNKKLREEKEALSALQRKKRKRDAAQFIVPPPASPGGPKACANCGRTGSPEWRTGPTGPKTLCNACGLRWSKARPSAASTGSSGSVQTLSGMREDSSSGSGSGSSSRNSTVPTPISSASEGKPLSDDPTRSLGHFPSSFDMSYSPSAFGAE